MGVQNPLLRRALSNALDSHSHQGGQVIVARHVVNASGHQVLEERPPEQLRVVETLNDLDPDDLGVLNLNRRRDSGSDITFLNRRPLLSISWTGVGEHG